MSKCDHCEQPARLRIKTVENLRLCERCADRWGVRWLGVPLGQWHRQLKGERRPYASCPFCGSTKEEIATTGLYGCAVCYLLFS